MAACCGSHALTGLQKQAVHRPVGSSRLGAKLLSHRAATTKPNWQWAQRPLTLQEKPHTGFLCAKSQSLTIGTTYRLFKHYEGHEILFCRLVWTGQPLWTLCLGRGRPVLSHSPTEGSSAGCGGLLWGNLSQPLDGIRRGPKQCFSRRESFARKGVTK